MISQDDEQERKIDETIDETEIYFQNNFETGKGSETTEIENIKSETPQNERRRPRQSSSSSSVVLAGSFSDLNTEEIDQKIEEYLVRAEDGSYTCGVCGKAGVSQKQGMQKHIETHMDGLSFPCQKCGKIFRSRNSRLKHRYTYH